MKNRTTSASQKCKPDNLQKSILGCMKAWVLVAIAGYVRAKADFHDLGQVRPEGHDAATIPQLA